MSLETWVKEFCPVPVEATKGWDDVRRLERDLKKWEGLRKENLDRHDGKLWDDAIRFRNEGAEHGDGGPYLHYDIAYECSLCAEYTQGRNPEANPHCWDCPLYDVREGFRCDTVSDDEDDEGVAAPWFRLCREGNPEPMIEWLEKALERALEQAQARAALKEKGAEE